MKQNNNKNILAVVLIVIFAFVGLTTIKLRQRMVSDSDLQDRLIPKAHIPKAEPSVSPETVTKNMPERAGALPEIVADNVPSPDIQDALRLENHPPKETVDTSGSRLLPELPKPMFLGTPRDLKAMVLQDSWAGVKQGVSVPPGTRLISHGKSVTSSDMMPIIGDLEMVTDGDKEGSDGSYVELGPGIQWVQIDLGSEYAIHAIAVWHYHSQARAYHDVTILFSHDPGFSKPVVMFNNDTDNSLGFGKGEDKQYLESHKGLLQAVNGVTARYVRLYSNGSTTGEMNHYIEVEVYGRPSDSNRIVL